jgi:hypothetical protein
MHRFRGLGRGGRLVLALAVGGAMFGIASAVQASIPDASGVIHGCYKTVNGALRVIDTDKGGKCVSSEMPLTWSQSGQKGTTGATGPQGNPGNTGATGATGPSGSDPAADAFIGKFGTNTNNAGAARGVECTLGQILLSASTLRTAGGLPASGQLLPINLNQALFALIGTTYGGNGVTTFALPDLRGLAPNNMTYSICDEGVFPSSR